jgi:hypothetical protein
MLPFRPIVMTILSLFFMAFSPVTFGELAQTTQPLSISPVVVPSENKATSAVVVFTQASAFKSSLPV